jgi:maltose alpha-D-glucosyltransferase/alpha-amylase
MEKYYNLFYVGNMQNALNKPYTDKLPQMISFAKTRNNDYMDFDNPEYRVHKHDHLEIFYFVSGKGYFSIPSGYHDIVRLAQKKDQDVLKTVFAFLLTYKHVPFIYYGDEIGITHDFNLNKDGGYIRTGARTPMQWTNGKNRGFSTTDGELYLPVNDQKSQSVEEQLNDENSLLNTVKQLAKLRNENPALNANAELEIIAVENGGYPLVYKRTDGKKDFVIGINPSEKSVEIDLYGKIVLFNNCKVDCGKIKLLGKSFVIMEK